MSDFQQLLHSTLQYFVFPLFLLTLLSYLSSILCRPPFLLVPWLLPANKYSVYCMLNISLLAYALFYCQHHPQALPESQLTPLSNICGLGLSKRPKGSGALGIRRYGELAKGHSPWGQLRVGVSFDGPGGKEEWLITAVWTGLCKEKTFFFSLRKVR